MTATIYASQQPAFRGGGAPALPVWAADGLGGTCTSLGSNAYDLDTATDWQGNICGPITGDFTCTIVPEFDVSYSLELGAVVGAMTDPSYEQYDGRESEAFYLFNPTGHGEWVINNKAGSTDNSATEVAPNSQTYVVQRVGSTLTFKKNGSTLFSRTMAGTLYLYTSQQKAGVAAASTVRVTMS